MKCISSFTLAFVLILSCAKTKQPSVAFYYWKTNFALSNYEKSIIKANNASKIYIRYFDVALQNNVPIPLSPIVFSSTTNQLTIVPVVFIKNEVLLNNAINTDDLANKLLSYINQINTKNKIAINEIQIDCDWTVKSKARYLKLITVLKSKTTHKLSATIRLHQVKYYSKTGIPAVDNGVLMYYNMGTINPDSSNSIYDRNIAKKYITSLKNYPLPLHVALPIYAWAIQIRNHKVLHVLGKLNNANFDNDTNFTKQTMRFYSVKNSSIKHGNYYKRGDIIKIENNSSQALNEMLSDIKHNINATPSEIIFYDLDQINLNQYTQNDLTFFKKISAQF